MAHFRKRSGAWETIVQGKGFGRISRTFDTRSDAEAWAKVTESEMIRGVYLSRKDAENTTLAEAMDRYLREVTVHKKNQRSERCYAETWKKYFGVRSMASITSSAIAKYRDDRLKAVSPNTVRLELALLSHLFTIAVKEWGMTGLANPVFQIRKPKLPGGRDRRLKAGELDRIASSTESPLLENMIRFAVETAMRREEISKMTWDLVDLKKKTTTILFPKNTRGTNPDKRGVPLTPEAVRILSHLPRRIDGKVWGMKPDSITRAFERAVKRARKVYEKECETKREKPDSSYLVDLTFHDLRHEATSRFFELGLDATKVKEITGHKTYSMLARYTHLKAEDIAIEIDNLEKERDRKAVENQAERLR